MSNKSTSLKRWTDDEVQMLTSHLDKILEETKGNSLLGMNTPTIKELADLFERSEAAVHHKARIIAVKLGKIPTSSTQIAKNAGITIVDSTEADQAFAQAVEAVQDGWLDSILSLVYGKVDYSTFKEIQKQLNK